MARYKTGDEVTYAGNKEIFTVVHYKEIPQCNIKYYVLEDARGNRHDCNQPHILRLHRRRFAEI